MESVENTTLKEAVCAFLNVNSSYGYGIGNGDGIGDGYGDGDGYGIGDGFGYGIGDGDGYGEGYGKGNGDCNGDSIGNGYGKGQCYGYSIGDGDGIGDGFGYGIGDGISAISINGVLYHSYKIDGMLTFVESVSLKRGILTGFFLQEDNTIRKCYVVKENNTFAHGETLHDAFNALQEKLYDYSTIEERLLKFKEHFTDFSKPYPNSELFVWHHIITGSCKFGREAFVKDHNIDVKNGTMTIYEFIELTKHQYNGEVIKELLKQ